MILQRGSRVAGTARRIALSLEQRELGRISQETPNLGPSPAVLGLVQMRPAVALDRWLVAVTVATLLLSCREPTQVIVEITTDINCSDHPTTGIAVGRLNELESRPLSTETHQCDPSTGRIGSIVVLPGDKKNGEFAIRVVSGITMSADDCVRRGYVGGCVIARRALGFVPEETLNLPIRIQASCIDVPCGATETCRNGSCVSAAIKNLNDCTDGATCDVTPPILSGGTGGKATGGTGGIGGGLGGLLNQGGTTSVPSTGGVGTMNTTGGSGGTGGNGANGSSGASSTGGTTNTVGGDGASGNANTSGSAGAATSSGLGGSGGAAGTAGAPASKGGTTSTGGAPASGGEGGSAGAACPANPPTAGDDPLIDDFEDGNSAISPVDGRRGTWSTKNDESVGGVQNPPPGAFTPTASGAHGSSYSARTWGGNFTDWGSALGFALNLSGANQCAYDASRYIGISFYAKGAGNVTISVATRSTVPVDHGGTCTTGCYDYHATSMIPTTNWVLYRIPWSRLAQKGWGTVAAFEPAEIVYLEFEFAAFTNFDFSIDDLSFY